MENICNTRPLLDGATIAFRVTFIDWTARF